MIGKQRLLAFDIGTAHIRAIELTPGRQRPVITFYEEFEAPPFPSEQRVGIIRTEGRQFFKQLPSRRAGVSLPGRGILVRVITVPKVPLGKLKEILKYEIQQQIPFPLEVVSWAYQIIAETEKNFQILLCAAKRDLVNEYLAHLLPFNLVLETLDTDFFALYNIYRYSPVYDVDTCQLLLEVGAQSANLIINHQDKVLMRSLTTSGDSISQNIADAQKIEFQEAERIKKEQGTQLPLISSLLETLNTELQNSIDYWRFTLKGPDIGQIIISGGLTNMIGYKEFLEQKTRVPVVPLNPFDCFDVHPDYQEALASKGPELVTACGIALRHLKMSYVSIEMIPVEILRMREFKENRPYIALSAIMVILLSLTPLYFLKQEQIAYRNYQKELEISLSQYEKFKPEVEKLRSAINEIKSKLGVVQNLLEKKSLWLARILEIGNTLPSSRIYLNNIYPGGSAPPPAAVAVAAPAAPAGAPAAPPGAPAAPPGAPAGAPPMPPGAPGAIPGAPPGAAPGAPGAPPTAGAPAPGAVPPAGPAVAQPAAAQPPSTLPEKIEVLTLDGEVVAVDVRTAFSDLKLFVQHLQKIEYFSQVIINSCELDKESGKLKFLLTLQLK